MDNDKQTERNRLFEADHEKLVELLEARHAEDTKEEDSTPYMSWWPDHKTFNWWGKRNHWAEVAGLVEPEPHTSDWLSCDDWSINGLPTRALKRALHVKRAPSRYDYEQIASMTCVWDDENPGFEWDVENQATNIAFSVHKTYHRTTASTDSEATIVCAHHKRLSEVAAWLRTDPVVQEKRISQHRADLVNKVYGAKLAREKEMLRRRIADRAYTRKEANALLEKLKATAILQMGESPHYGAEAEVRVAVPYRDGIEGHEYHARHHESATHRKLTCVVSFVSSAKPSNNYVHKACFYWGNYTDCRPDPRKQVLSDLQELFSWDNGKSPLEGA